MNTNQFLALVKTLNTDEFVAGYADALQGKPRRVKRPNGFVIYSDTWRVVIATGFARRSTNDKTHDMVQVWILPKRVDPVEASRTGQDSLVCGQCPARHALGGECYVRLDQAPLIIWRCWQRGGYPPLPGLHVFSGRMTRFGAYGDPTHIPLALVAAIAEASKGWTGYTHQWRNPLLAGFKQYLMASADDFSEKMAANKAGWRTFRVAPVGEGEAWGQSDEISCPASAEMGHRSNCDRCGLCKGGAIHAKNIKTRNHSGLAKLRYRAQQRRQQSVNQ